MKGVQKLILAAGLGTLGFLLWKMDVAEVGRLVWMVGWGFGLILGQEIVAHLFNALGWRFSFRKQHSSSVPFKDLLLFRVVGDSINYLTPSAQIAGEFTRASLLGPSRPIEVRTTSVVVAKFAQGFAQFLFALFGAALLVEGQIPVLVPYEGTIRTAAAVLALVLLVFIVYEKVSSNRSKSSTDRLGYGLGSVPKHLKAYLKDHPGRLSLAILMFGLGYAWGAFEVYWICKFIGLSISLETAILIEVMSCIIDGILFMVPAKMGTQEAGKTAIFVLLGLPAQSGLAFGIVRHIRELSWASMGLAIYSVFLKTPARNKRPSPFLPKREKAAI